MSKLHRDMNRVNVFAIHRCINEGYGLIRIFAEKIRISPTKLWLVWLDPFTLRITGSVSIQASDACVSVEHIASWYVLSFNETKSNMIGLKINDAVCLDKSLIAEQFNVFFSNIAHKLVKNLPVSPGMFGMDCVIGYYQSCQPLRIVRKNYGI